MKVALGILIHHGNFCLDHIHLLETSEASEMLAVLLKLEQDGLHDAEKVENFVCVLAVHLHANSVLAT